MLNIKKGSRGKEVEDLQRALKQQGYNVGVIDGIFGKDTETALKAYQTKLGVTADGILGDWVASKLYDSAPVVPQVPSKKKTVTITAGHSNTDPGAVNGRYREADLAVEFRNGICLRLEKLGYVVLTDGTSFVNNNLNTAISLAKKADLAIEFHLNASDNKTAKGVEVLSLDKDKTLSQLICAAISRVLDTPVRGSDKGWKSQSSGQHSRLGFCVAGGLIVESFFISNEAELNKYLGRREALYDAIVEVIVGYLK